MHPFDLNTENFLSISKSLSLDTLVTEPELRGKLHRPWESSSSHVLIRQQAYQTELRLVEGLTSLKTHPPHNTAHRKEQYQLFPEM